LIIHSKGRTLFEKNVLRSIGPSREEETGGWRKLHKEEFISFVLFTKCCHNLKPSRMRWEEHVVRMEEVENA